MCGPPASTPSDGLEPGFLPEPGEQGEARERGREREREPERHVPEPVVAELVREHRLQLPGRERRDQRIEEHDALVAPEPGEVGVAVRAAARAVHDVDAARLESAAARERLDGVAQRARLEFAEAIEERRDEARPRPADEDRERGPGAECVQPPGGTGACHEPQQQRDEREQEQCADREALERVRREQRRRRAVEAKAPLDTERAPGVEWQTRRGW